MFTQNLLYVLACGIILLVFNLVRSYFCGKTLSWNLLRLLSYALIAVSSTLLTAISRDYFVNDQGHFWAVAISPFAPRVLEFLVVVIVGVLSTNRKSSKNGKTVILE